MANQSQLAKLALVVIAAVVFILLVNSYQADNVQNNVNNVQEGFNADGEDVEESPVVGANVEEEVENDNEMVNASEGEGDENVTFRNVPENQPEPEQNNNNNNNNTGRLPSECYPKDTLTPQDLLPQDSNSTWAQTVPAGQGSLGDQNFLNAGFHVGINTVGQSLRNANLQLRSEPANPQMKVSPWLQTTIEPDNNRKALEIGA
jgi:hypothetical protein